MDQPYNKMLGDLSQIKSVGIEEMSSASGKDYRKCLGTGRQMDSPSKNLESNSTLGDGNQHANGVNSIKSLMEISHDHRRFVPLPLELKCQIFECLKFGIQRKFICGLGMGIYGIFRHKVLSKRKRLQNPEQNGWQISSTGAVISYNGLVASNKPEDEPTIYAKKGFPIADEHFRMDDFHGAILYYFEVTIVVSLHRLIMVGLSNGNIPDGNCVGFSPNSYAIQEGWYSCWLSGNRHQFEWANGRSQPRLTMNIGDVLGCGLLLNPENELCIFFTVNGTFMGKQIPINLTATSIFPTVSLLTDGSIEGNFGDDPAKPFIYDIKNCPGLDIRKSDLKRKQDHCFDLL